ncbi:phosphatase PAP2 family protein [Ornithinibacillus sp. L9]|uniref:Phosphatase PAP2 family protein n=1 Tax=Ornithinibacillus caprae TaxID=2678566 RepID=A0A6N8FDP7_9BACI|nr:phosphatase PAP2 family protein [Ornithinibacillus caprae]MUK87650.1 phosphatase PAP2 family protein [Ornithinibacillus caprae]
MKYLNYVYEVDCRYFRIVNKNFEKRFLHSFFRKITHLGSASFTISIVLFLILFSTGSTKLAVIASGIALALSHIPVMLIKKFIPRKRPYLVLHDCHVTENPLTDCSFPSGHTTAFFSIIIPFCFYYSVLAIILLPLGFLVGLSRVYLGLHYPSDIVFGCLLGSLVGSVSFILVFQ